ncbi:hypothetical protein PC116_g29661 [Phytophthora cactorum]|nr:hypothetical protein PC116_g29661 [Phytophthora cactorum]
MALKHDQLQTLSLFRFGDGAAPIVPLAAGGG